MTVPPVRLPKAISLLPLLTLLLAPTLLLWKVVFQGDIFLPADLLRDIAPWRDPAHPVPWNPLMWDGMAEFYPWRLFYARTLHQGYLPLWNPHQFCGTPFLANSQSAVLYPLNLLFVLLPVARAFGASVWLHLVLTGLLMYGFLRSQAIGVSRPAATLGAITWQLSTWQTGWLALPTFLCVSAWLPLALWLTHRLVLRPTAGRATALGITLGITILAGHLQIALYVLLLTVAYALFLSISRLRADRTCARPLLFRISLALVLMSGMAAPQILPTLELSRVSHRAGGHVSAINYAAYTRLAVPPINLLTLYLPGFFGNPTDGTYWGIGTNGGPGAYIENGAYIGILGLLLAFAGAGRRHAAGRFFTGAGIVALLLALGTPLNALLYFTLPGFAQSGSPGRILVLWTFCAAVMAGVGADALLTMTRHRLISVLLTFGISLLTCLIGTLAWITRTAPGGTLAANLSREPDLWRVPVGILLGATVCFVLWRRRTLTGNVFVCCLVLLSMADLLAANIGFNRTSRPQDVYPVTPGIRFLQDHAQGARIMPVNRIWSLYAPPPAVLPPNSATVYGLYDVQGYDSLLTRRYMAWAAQLDTRSPAPPENGNMVFTDNANSPLLKDALVCFVVTRVALPPSSELKLVFQDREMFVYDTGLRMNEAGIAADRTIPSRLSLRRMRGTKAGAVTVADQWYPGWQTRNPNGKWMPALREAGVFRVIADTGSATRPVRAEMRYWPDTFLIGMYLLGLTITGACGVGCTALIQSGRRWRAGRT